MIVSRLLSFSLAFALLTGAPLASFALDAEMEKLILKGYGLRQRGDFTGAESTYKEAIEIGKKQGEDSIDYASALSMLAGLYLASDRLKESQELYLQIISILEKATSPEAKLMLMTNYDNISTTYTNLGQPEKALEYNSKAMSYFESIPNLPPTELAKCLNNRASIYTDLHKYSEAKDAWERAAALVKDTSNDAFKAILADNMAQAYNRLGQPEKAYEVRKDALKKMVAAYGPTHPEVAKCLGNLSTLAFEMNSLSEAASYSEQQLDILRTAFGAKHPATIDALKRYLIILERQNKTAEAEAVAKQIADAGQTAPSGSKAEPKLVPIVWANIMEKAGKAFQTGRITEADTEAKAALIEAQKSDSKRAMVLSYEFLAQVYEQEGKLALAEENARKAVSIAESIGAESEELAEALNVLGLRLFAESKFTETEEVFKKGIALREKLAGTDSPDLITPRYNLATVYQQQGKLKEAEQMYQELLPLCEKIKGPDDSQTLKLMSNLAGIYGARAKYDEEISLLQRAVAAEEKKNGPDSRDLATLLNNLGTAYSLQGKSAEAEKLFIRVGKLTEKYHGPNSIEMAKNLNNLATIYINQKKFAAAEAATRRSLAIREKIFGPNSHELAGCLSNLSVICSAQKKMVEAQTYARRALTLEEKTMGPKHPSLSLLLNNLAELEARTGKKAEAEQHYKRAIQVVEANFGPTHPSLVTLLNNEAILLTSSNRKTEAQKLLNRANAIKSKLPANQRVPAGSAL